ncbi:hypothetical protein FOA52_007500 [Chlamydomonas sp. UWO 241]|nr:hypothetical protein FOA52_007500 [Chlamydomonas sp. UWO 241]
MSKVPRALALASTETYIAERVAAILSAPAIFAKLADQTSRVMDAMAILFSNGLLTNARCMYKVTTDNNATTNNVSDCKVVWQVLVQHADKALSPMLEDPALFDADTLATLLSLLKDGLVAFQPLSGLQPMLPPGHPSQDFVMASPFKPPVERTRGGVTALYSQPFFKFESNSGKFSIRSVDPLLVKAGLPTLYASPFKSILAISNGVCSSTCATWGITAWLYSKTTPGAPALKRLSYGGTGHKQNLQPLQMAGGILADPDLGRPETPKLWAYWALFSLLGEWLGDGELADAAVGLLNKLPAFPALGNDLDMPGYPSGALFSHVLGGAAGSAPAEYLQWPTDHYLRKWIRLRDATLQRGAMLLLSGGGRGMVLRHPGPCGAPGVAEELRYLNVKDVDSHDVWPLYADAEVFLPAA